MTPEILFIFFVSFAMPDGSIADPVEFVLADGLRYCVNKVACSFIDERIIYVNINHLDKKDSCSRDPVTHEFMHFKYPDIDIHNRCDLNS